jgi:hypothetical protein
MSSKIKDRQLTQELQNELDNKASKSELSTL